MRQVLSWRFVATIGALLGLTFFVYVAFADGSSISEVVAPSSPTARRTDLVALALSSAPGEGFAMANGRAGGELTMDLVPDDRTAKVFPGTPGEITCPDLTKPCALLAETLGDTITWFALVPMGANFQFELPAIESLDGGYANLVNGWQVPYASVIDRSRCEDVYPAESFSEFLKVAGTNFRAVYNLGRASITSVIC
ncbi:MAG: hypothetical protein ABW328_07765 [Ilumatobacteraceae bacterium]